MSAEQPTFSTSDLRSGAQDYKRDATHKHKWALGMNAGGVGRTAGSKPRPHRPAETAYNIKRRESKAAVAAVAAGVKVARKHDMREGRDDNDSDTSFSSSTSTSSAAAPHAASPEPDAHVMYSFDAPTGPSHGSQILNAALARAVRQFEDKETQRLVSTEYDLIDLQGESVAGPSAKRNARKGHDSGEVKGAGGQAGRADDEDEYEFV